MQIKNKFFGAVGVAALGLTILTGPMASAQDSSDSIQASVTISCPDVATVEVGGDANFDTINILDENDTQTGDGAIEVTVDMGCYWGGWSVSAQSTNFSAGPGMSFSASHLSLQDATTESWYLQTGVPLADAITRPDASDAFFSSSSDSDTILETNESFVWWLLNGDATVPAPFVTEASYTGVLTDIPFLAFSGDNTYTATITVDLALES
jgi:hypothetical protein